MLQGSKRARSSAVPPVPPLTTRSANKGRGRPLTSEQPPDTSEPSLVEPTPKVEETPVPENTAIRRQSKFFIRYLCMLIFAGKRKASVLEDHDGTDKKRPREESEPVEEEPQGRYATNPCPF